MALRGFKAFSDDEVIFVKQNLIRGVTVSDVARHFGVSGETISKIKRGLTYTRIWVPGEEALRPQSPLGERAIPQGPIVETPRRKAEEELNMAEEESKRMLFESLGLNSDGTTPN